MRKWDMSTRDTWKKRKKDLQHCRDSIQHLDSFGLKMLIGVLKGEWRITFELDFDDLDLTNSRFRC